MILQITLQITHLQSLVQNTLQRKLHHMLQLELQHALTLILQPFNIITSTTVAIIITSPLIVYSRGIEQHISVRKIPVHVF